MGIENDRERDEGADKCIDKCTLRKAYLSRREAQGDEARVEKSGRILMKLLEQAAFVAADSILIYVDFRGEVATTPLLKELLKNRDKKVYCPKITGMKMDFYEISDMMQLKEGYYGIKEPEASAELRFTLDSYHRNNCLMIMPGVVFDRSRGRIGYGKGYYDHFLAEYPGLKTIALAYDCQIAPQVPLNEYDKRPDMIITETEII